MMAHLVEPDWIFKKFSRKIINVEEQVEELSETARMQAQRMCLEVGHVEKLQSSVVFSQDWDFFELRLGLLSGLLFILFPLGIIQDFLVSMPTCFK